MSSAYNTTNMKMLEHVRQLFAMTQIIYIDLIDLTEILRVYTSFRSKTNTLGV